MNINKYSRSPIAKKLLFITVGVSTTIALIITIIQLIYDYFQDIRRIESTLQQIEITSIPSISVALWDLNNEQLQVQIQSLMKITEVTRAEIIRPNKDTIAYGIINKNNNKFIKEYLFDLIYHDQEDNSKTNLGRLKINYDYKTIYKKLAEKLVLIFILNCIKTLTVSLVILFVFWRLVTNHIINISDRLNHFETNLKSKGNILVDEQQDAGEINTLIKSINKFYTSFNSISQANQNKNKDRTNEEDKTSNYDHEFFINHDSKSVPCSLICTINDTLLKIINEYKNSLNESLSILSKESKYHKLLTVNADEARKQIESYSSLSEKINSIYKISRKCDPVFYYINDISDIFEKLPSFIKKNKLIIEDDIMFSADYGFLEKSLQLIFQLVEDTHHPDSLETVILKKNMIIYIVISYSRISKKMVEKKELSKKIENSIYIMNLYLQQGLQGKLSYDFNDENQYKWTITFPSLSETP